MRDVSHKVSTLREAVAKAVLRVSPSTIEQIRTNTLPKGNPLSVAKVAAIQAEKILRLSYLTAIRSRLNT